MGHKGRSHNLCHVMYPAASVNNMPGPAEPEESVDALKLCPRENFVKLCKQRAEEVLCSSVK